jgi:hypothetical protein
VFVFAACTKAFKDFGNSFGQSSLSSVYDDLRKQAAALAKLESKEKNSETDNDNQ